MTRIAVSETLTNVSQYLSEQGYDIVSFTQSIPDSGVAAAVFSGENENIMGIMEEGKFPIILANGLTAEEVFQQLQDRIQNQ